MRHRGGQPCWTTLPPTHRAPPVPLSESGLPETHFESKGAAAAKSGDLVEKYEPVGCYGEMPTAKEQKLAYREAAKADLKAGRVVRA